MKKMLCGLVVAAFALAAVAPASAAIAPRVTGEPSVITVAAEKKKAPAKKTASKKSTKKQTAKKPAKKSAPKTA